MGTPADIQAMLDRGEIVELTSRYAFLVDTFQLRPLMELWVADDPIFDESRVDGVCIVLVEGEMRTGETMHAAAYYDDVYEKVDNTWKFKSRTVYPLTTPQLGSLVS